MNGIMFVDECGRLYEVCWNCRGLMQVTVTDATTRTKFAAITGSKTAEVVQQRLNAYALKHGFVAYPDVVCTDCAMRTGKTWPEGHVATFYPGICGICGIMSIVTQPRDWGHWRTAEELNALHRVAHEGG